MTAGPFSRRAARIPVALLVVAAAAAEPAVAQTLPTLGGRGVLGIMGYNMVPDGSANALQINTSSARGDEDGNPIFSLAQTGFGFTASETVPIFLEWYAGYARYDPRSAFTGEPPGQSPLRWNNVTTTIGIGYDIQLTEHLWLRPVLNGALGYAASDLSLFGSFLNIRRGIEIPGLEKQHVTAWGRGGSLMLAYYDFREEGDVDIELRYTYLLLETFGDTVPAARGRSDAQTLGLWARYRWPTGVEAFGRPVRWVLDGSATTYFGDQQDVMGFTWAVKAGGGIEFDTGRWELGAFGLNLNRVRLVGRYFRGDNNVTGYSFGIGMTF
jgi:hypothetical protein